MVENQRVITKVYFPRLILPMSAVVSGLVDFAIGFLVFLAMMLYYGIHPGRAVLILPVFLLLAVLTALGVGLWLSALNAIYRDVRYVVPFLVQFWMFASPVAYPSPRTGALALALRPESHGRSDRRVPLGAHRHRRSAEPDAARIVRGGAGRPGGRADVLSEDGNHGGRCGVKRTTRRLAPTLRFPLNRLIELDKPVNFMECSP